MFFGQVLWLVVGSAWTRSPYMEISECWHCYVWVEIHQKMFLLRIGFIGIVTWNIGFLAVVLLSCNLCKCGKLKNCEFEFSDGFVQFWKRLQLYQDKETATKGSSLKTAPSAPVMEFLTTPKMRRNLPTAFSELCERNSRGWVWWSCRLMNQQNFQTTKKRESTNVNEQVDREEDASQKMLMEKKLISELD